MESILLYVHRADGFAAKLKQERIRFILDQEDASGIVRFRVDEQDGDRLMRAYREFNTK